MRSGFLWIFWGLLLVVLHIRVGGLELLPDFVGYLLIFKGLGNLSSAHPYFRKARPFALVMIFLSIPSMFRPSEASIEPQLARRLIFAAVTRDLGTLLPQRVGNASLDRSTNNASELDSSRSHNPAEDGDKVLGEYSDGTRVLILRYRSWEAAVSAMHEKAQAEYSAEGIRKHQGPDSKLDPASIHVGHSENASGNVRTGVSSSTFTDSLDIEQWWSQGWVLGSPSTWRSSTGWSRNLLFIVEGSRASADAYRKALGASPGLAAGYSTASDGIGGSPLSFQGMPRTSPTGPVVTLSPVSPILIVGAVLETVLIWLICSGIMGLASALRLEEFAGVARSRRSLYIIFTVVAWPVPVLWLAEPNLAAATGNAAIAALIVIHALVVLLTLCLILALVRRCASTFADGKASPIDELPERGAFGNHSTI
jgi:hypothetical protein